MYFLLYLGRKSSTCQDLRPVGLSQLFWRKCFKSWFLKEKDLRNDQPAVCLDLAWFKTWMGNFRMTMEICFPSIGVWPVVLVATRMEHGCSEFGLFAWNHWNNSPFQSGQSNKNLQLQQVFSLLFLSHIWEGNTSQKNKSQVQRMFLLTIPGTGTWMYSGKKNPEKPPSALFNKT